MRLAIDTDGFMPVHREIVPVYERDGHIVQAAEFVDWIRADTARLYAAGVRLFEVRNEPNLISEPAGLRDG